MSPLGLALLLAGPIGAGVNEVSAPWGTVAFPERAVSNGLAALRVSAKFHRPIIAPKLIAYKTLDRMRLIAYNVGVGETTIRAVPQIPHRMPAGRPLF